MTAAVRSSSSSMMASSSALLLLILLLAATTSSSVVSAAASSSANNNEEQDDCEWYLAPSHLKNAASHGFGLGIFSGRDIPRGTILTDLHEIILPLYDSATLDVTHPPLREYLWPSVGALPELSLHVNDRQKAFWFGGGISSMAPCTWRGYNVQINAGGNFAGAPRWNVLEDVEGVPSRNDPSAGSYSYRHGMTYIVTRHIHPGEELVVDCSDDNFDSLSLLNEKRRNTYQPNDDSYMCLDNVRTGESHVVSKNTQTKNIGKGLFAAKSLSKDDVVLSSPVVPIHRRDLFGDGTGKTAPSGINNYQLMLNYALGHEDSDLLLLPYGPFVNYINHPPPGKKANAVLRWHSNDNNAEMAKEGEALPRRMEFHHKELFQEYTRTVTETHGKGLVIDIVALEKIDVGSEIYIDYGSAWSKAWDDHVKRYKAPSDASNYLTADQWFNNNKLNLHPETVKTAEEQLADPYPNNVQTVCYYDSDAKIEKVDEENNIIYAVWEDNSLPHECMRPCTILERYADDEYRVGDRLGLDYLYKAEMMHFEGEENFWFCNMKPGRHIARDVSYDGILIVDKPYSHDIFLDSAFRHEIGVPNDFYPREWLRSKVRSRKTEEEPTRSMVGDEFRRKKIGEYASRKMPKEEL